MRCDEEDGFARTPVVSAPPDEDPDIDIGSAQIIFNIADRRRRQGKPKGFIRWVRKQRDQVLRVAEHKSIQLPGFDGCVCSKWILENSGLGITLLERERNGAAFTAR